MGRGDVGQAVERALEGGLHVQVWPGLPGVSSQRLRMSPLSGMPMLYVEPHQPTKAQAAVKRAVDLVVSILIGLAALPVLGMSALLIKIEDGGPVLYRSVRIGRKGAPFTVWKLRTMVSGADRQVVEVEELNERIGGPLFKVSEDPRVTRVGRLLRRASIDELPQLWNVLNGSMSLVGPRPAFASEVEQFDPELRRRHELRPGITGLWQVEARDNPSFSAYRRLDLAYVDNWSVWLDIEILATTAYTVLSRAVGSVVRHR